MLQIKDTMIVKEIEVDDNSIKSIVQENIKLTKEIDSKEHDILMLETQLQTKLSDMKSDLKKCKETLKTNRELIKEYREMKPVIALNTKKILVNVTWDWAVIHKKIIDWLEYNEERGDRIFNTLKEANDYVQLLSSE